MRWMRARALMITAGLVATGLTLAVTDVIPAAPAGAIELAPSIDPFDRTSVAAAYEDALVAARTVPVGWTGSTSSCTPGTETQASIDATRAAVNFYRGLNQLGPVTMDPALNTKAMSAALIMQAKGQLNHYPPSTWPCWTQQGYAAAGSSNLSQGATGARAVDLYIEDPGAGNEIAGHRRWLLNPTASTMGTGSTTGFNAVHIYGKQAARPAGVSWVAWPSAGFVPKSLVKPLWSLSSSTFPNADFTAAKVTVKVGSTSLPVKLHPVANGYGDNALTWTVTLPSGFTANDDDVTFDVSVSGIKKADGSAIATRSYSTTAFVRSVPATVPGAPSSVIGTPGDGQVTVAWKAPSSTGGASITGYQITPFVDGRALPAVTSSGTGTSKVLTGLANGTAYTFKVAAVNRVGTGALSGASAAVTPAKPPFAPFASWGAFVDRMHVDITAKPPTASARSSWISQLTAGTKTKGDLVDALRRGSENLANVDPVVRVYRAFLGRAPDAGGLVFWINRKRNVAPARTWSVGQIAESFTSSSEFQRKYGSMSNRAFVTQIYTDILGRAADPSGVNYWTGRLDAKAKTRAQVVLGFSESSEYKRKQLENTDVTVAYVFLLDRAPSTAEATAWTDRQKAGTPHATLAGELLDSDAYARHLAIP